VLAVAEHDAVALVSEGTPGMDAREHVARFTRQLPDLHCGSVLASATRMRGRQHCREREKDDQRTRECEPVAHAPQCSASGL
jgi:hypothetical protein